MQANPIWLLLLPFPAIFFGFFPHTPLFLGDFRSFAYLVYATYFPLLLREKFPIPPSHFGFAFFAISAWAFLGASLSSYWAFTVNGFDFSVFDWMLTNLPMYSPIYRVYHLGIHPSWYLYLLAPLHAFFSSPYFLLCIGPILLWSAILPLYRICQKQGLPGYATYLVLYAFLGTVFVQVLVKEGFRIEMAEPLALFLFLLYWDSKSSVIKWLSAFFLLSIKEDTALYLGAFACYELFYQKKDGAFLLALSVLIFTANTFLARPYFLATTKQDPEYLRFWSHYGNHLSEIILTMIKNPLQMIIDTLSSGFFKLYLPLLFLPFLSKKALAFSLPGIFILGTATAYPSMHAYGHYYPLLLFCLAIYAMIDIYPHLPNPLAKKLWINALFISTICGAGSLKIKPPDFSLLDDLAKTRGYLASNLKNEPICTEASAFPYLGYELDLQPLDETCLQASAHMVIIRGANPYPYDHLYIEGLIASADLLFESGKALVLRKANSIPLP